MTGASSPVVQNAAVGKRPAEVCLNDLRVFGEQMQEEGYWLGGSAHAYDDPMGAHGDGDPMSSRPADRTVGYLNARPGYKTRILLASANILARSGQQQLVRGRARHSSGNLQRICGQSSCSWDKAGRRSGSGAAASSINKAKRWERTWSAHMSVKAGG